MPDKNKQNKQDSPSISQGLKWTAERAKKETEQTVFKELAKKSPQRWGELLRNTKLSSRTLKNALERMQKNNLITREIDQGKEYPPPVLYGLTPEAKLSFGPLLLESYIKQIIFGTEKDEITLKTLKNPPKLEGISYEESPQLMRLLKPEIADPKERLATIARRIGAFYLLTLLKAVEEGNYDWMPEARSLLDYDQTVEAALGFGIPEQKHKRVRVQAKKKIIADLVINTSPLVIPSKEEIRKTIELLKEALPQESNFLSSTESFIEYTKGSQRQRAQA